MRKNNALIAAAIAFAAVSSQAAPATTKAEPAPAAAAQPAAAAPAAPATGVMSYGVKLGGFFNDQHKKIAQDYFKRYAKGKECPEGMERNGKQCKPPVEGRYWAVGQPLQKAVNAYPLPDALKSQLPPAPQGYEYLRAGEDILLVSSNSMHFVVDILEDVI